MKFKIGSLFDGSGGFPLAASMCGIEPVWAAEVEPYPIAVTCSRFPNMKHSGSVTEVKGNEVEPVDVITFGSPCQDLSVAGKRAGLKHTENGDEETTRSGLFMEAVRIIKEMREATNGLYPRFAVWENVPGAFSSNKGEDFRIVLEEFIKVIEPTAVMPAVPKNGWPYADSYCGDGWSLAYRVFDAQFWGVPQRRRRIYLVADFRGQCAGKISFEREGLRGYFAESGTAWQATAGDAENCVGTADCGERVNCADDIAEPVAFDTYNMVATGDKTVTLRAGSEYNYAPVFQPVSYGVWQAGDPMNTLTSGDRHAVAYAMQGFGDYKKSDVASGLKARDYKDATDLVAETPIALDRAFYNQGQNAQYEPQFYDDGTVPTLVARGPAAVCHSDVAGVDCRNATEYPEMNGTLQAKSNGGFSYNCNQVVRVRYIVRRLTPTECARLQGFPDNWGHPDIKETLSDEEYAFWLNVRNTHAAINGKAVKEYTKEQILKWYNGLHTDSSEYKMWGNGIALPCALYVMQGIADALGED